MSGLGTSTLFPIGFGVSQPRDLAPSSPLLADYIDPTTNDYVSLFDSLDPIDAAVINALKIVRTSGAAVTQVGNRFRLLRKITNSIEREIQNLVQEALQTLIRNGDIAYQGTDILRKDLGGGQIDIRITWRNLRSFVGAVSSTVIRYTVGG